MIMTHPGLPIFWGLVVLTFLVVTLAWSLAAPIPHKTRSLQFSLARLPVIGNSIRSLITQARLLFVFKLIVLALFLLIIVAGLFGTPIAERNLATVLTWNLWWSGLVFSIFFIGSAWCAVCPWNALAQWLVRRRLWKRAVPNNSLNLRVPRRLQNIWPALLLFIGLTWLELGVGITTSPYATALVSLLMVILATASLAIFNRNAFCRFFCPVGRTVGFYSQLAPVELRPINQDICADCKTLECYHGNQHVEPCPTSLVMGRLKQNSYCTSCGNCVQSCPHQNVAWRLRSPSVEALQNARPRWDEAWFMIGLLALTVFHGLSMMPFWEPWMSTLARTIGDSGQLLVSFTLGMTAAMFVIIALYLFFVAATRLQVKSDLPFKQFFSRLAFVSLPLAFSYHMAHNLNHLVRETVGIGTVLQNPLGVGTQPLSMMEKHARHLEMIISQDTLFALQAGLIVFGFWIAVQIVRHRGRTLLPNSGQSIWRLWPMLTFITGMTGLHVWLLMQPMIMRM